jgi:hypothetical protein
MRLLKYRYFLAQTGSAGALIAIRLAIHLLYVQYLFPRFCDVGQGCK